eukprot:TRINITY_DN814_c3_g1_i1.p1 TRINITY_DN814_c3_g1~~TRINITY_DN814_c3_g1_i1.p1  ORF type:complete len:123 (-),score=33.92 TRINITY_DN814_c3_g1_i1:39-407(-)
MALPAPKRLGEEYEVIIGGDAKRPGKWSLGCFTFQEPKGLRIAAVHSVGGIAEWNEKNPEQQVKAGDLIVEVAAGLKSEAAGTRGSGTIIYEQLMKVPRPAKIMIAAGRGHQMGDSLPGASS